MPKPKDGESQKDFVSRCIPIVMDDGTAKDNKQAAAICYSMWRKNVQKFNPHHAPAGGPTGGQFTSGDGNGNGKDGAKKEIDFEKQATVEKYGTQVYWKSEDTVAGDVVIETQGDFDTNKVTDDQLAEFVKNNPDKIAIHLEAGDVENVKISKVERGKGYIKFTVDITPTEEAGNRWIEAVDFGEQWATYHETSMIHGPLSLSVTLKTDATNGRVRWKAIANSGEFDQQGDRFDETFFDDIVANFWAVQDAVSRGEAAPSGFAHPEGKPIPQLDVAHYSFQLGRSNRVKARVGVPTFAYRDGRKMILQGHFEATPLGSAASKSVLADETDVIRTSIGVWPDWSNVKEMPDGKRVFKGGGGVAYLDHLALTAHPVDARTEIQAEGEMAKSLQVKDDAMEVLGDKALVDELEAACTASKSQAPNGALVKAVKTVDGKDYPASDFLVVEDSAQPSTWHLQVKENGKANHTLMGGAYAALLTPGGHRGNKYEGPGKEEAVKKLRALYNSEDMPWPGDEKKSDAKAEPVAESVVTVTHETTAKDVTTVEKDAKADAIEAKAAELAAQVITTTPTAAPQAMPMEDSLAIARAINETRSVLAEAIKAIGARLEVLEKSQPNLSAINDLATALNKSIEATQATEAQKVKAMLDNRGWLDIAKLYSARSATDNTVDGGARAKGPQEADPQLQAGGPIAGRFMRT